MEYFPPLINATKWTTHYKQPRLTNIALCWAGLRRSGQTWHENVRPIPRLQRCHDYDCNSCELPTFANVATEAARKCNNFRKSTDKRSWLIRIPGEWANCSGVQKGPLWGATHPITSPFRRHIVYKKKKKKKKKKNNGFKYTSDFFFFYFFFFFFLFFFFFFFFFFAMILFAKSTAWYFV